MFGGLVIANNGFDKLSANAAIPAMGFTGLKLRLGWDRLRDDLATLDAVREALGEDVQLMIDFNQGLNLAEAIERCHAIDGHGLAWTPARPSGTPARRGSRRRNGRAQGFR